ncbi:hypothetical protein [uncultured Aquimarina sp.]|uniref:hypothetical protein n=1 Tax=uncultured Aquimarina sp. TaxID=575652 RepID=UPI00261F2AC0|nr:hypothetical protein [uncultured Aquimarina sp.]
MRLKIGIAFILFCVCSISFGQDYKSNTKSLKEVDIKIEEGQYSADDSVSADRLIIESSENAKLGEDYNTAFTDEEWADIKEQILNNKKRITENNEVFVSKTIDTVFVTAASFDKKSQLSGW